MTFPPIFPPELEYEIFLLAFQNESENPGNLLLVAKRVHEWLIPRMYRTVVFRDKRRYPPNVSTSAMRQYGHHTRDLLLCSATSPMKVISYCPNVKNLAIWNGSWSDRFGLESYNKLTSLQLKRLSIHLGELEDLGLDMVMDNGDEELVANKKQVKENIIRFFSTITHLDICSRVHRQREVWVLRHFTSLTHICVFDCLPPQILRWIFDVCKELKVVVWLIDNMPVEEGEAEKKLINVVANEDWRSSLEHGGGLAQEELEKVVFIRCNGYGEDWEHGARGDQDIWGLAERAVQAAKDGRESDSSLVTRISDLRVHTRDT